MTNQAKKDIPNSYYFCKHLILLSMATVALHACADREEYPERLSEFDRDQLSRLIAEVTR